MGRQATAVWPLRTASGGAPKRGPKILQELHADAPEMFDELLARVGPGSPSNTNGTGSPWSLA